MSRKQGGIGTEGTNKLPVYCDDVNVLGENITAIKRKRKLHIDLDTNAEQRNTCSLEGIIPVTRCNKKYAKQYQNVENLKYENPI